MSLKIIKIIKIDVNLFFLIWIEMKNCIDNPNPKSNFEKGLSITIQSIKQIAIRIEQSSNSTQQYP